MEITWNIPKLKYGINPPAIYRLDFDTGHFYIGSSKAVKTRINSWRTMVKYDRCSSKIFLDSIKLAKSAKVSIIEQPAINQLLEREEYYLSINSDNQFLLNRSLSAYGNTALKPLPPHLVKPKKKYVSKKPKKGKFIPSEDHVWAFSKGVIQFDLSGNYIQSHKTIQDAANAVGVKRKFIYENMQVKRHRYGVKGFVFKVCGDNSPIELLVKKDVVVNENSGKVKSKVVIDTITGDKLTAEQVAEKLGKSLKATYKILGEYEGKVNNTQYKYGEGYIWKYA